MLASSCCCSSDIFGLLFSFDRTRIIIRLSQVTKIQIQYSPPSPFFPLSLSLSSLPPSLYFALSSWPFCFCPQTICIGRIGATFSSFLHWASSSRARVPVPVVVGIGQASSAVDSVLIVRVKIYKYLQSINFRFWFLHSLFFFFLDWFFCFSSARFISYFPLRFVFFPYFMFLLYQQRNLIYLVPSSPSRIRCYLHTTHTQRQLFVFLK